MHCSTPIEHLCILVFIGGPGTNLWILNMTVIEFWGSQSYMWIFKYTGRLVFLSPALRVNHVLVFRISNMILKNFPIYSKTVIAKQVSVTLMTCPPTNSGSLKFSMWKLNLRCAKLIIKEVSRYIFILITHLLENVHWHPKWIAFITDCHLFDH